jgi:hypothetical protein
MKKLELNYCISKTGLAFADLPLFPFSPIDTVFNILRVRVRVRVRV